MAGVSEDIRDLTDDEARAAMPLKWGVTGPGVVPAWVAEMDYALPPAITHALAEAARGGTTGYPRGDDGSVGSAFAGFALRHWDWAVPPEATTVVGDTIAGLRLALAALCPPGPVVVPLPCYPPFREVLALAGRELVPVVVDPDAPTGAPDLDRVERALAAGARTILLCNPHNPLGHVPSRAELEALRDLARAHGARVVSDEIHAPLVLPGAHFTPYLTVDPDGILVTSHSKMTNTAGLHTAQVVVLGEEDQAAMRGLPHLENRGFTPVGMLAAVAAWERCDEWRDALLARLAAQRDLLTDLLATHLPKARTRPLEATYLAWLDLREHAVADPAAAGLRHGVMVSPGHDFQPGLEGHVRLNIATSPERLEQAVTRLARALEGEAA